MKKEAYCRWHDKPLREVSENEQEQCYENGMDCTCCDNLVTDNSGMEENDETRI